jgi:hypothetical protein
LAPGALRLASRTSTAFSTLRCRGLRVEDPAHPPARSFALDGRRILAVELFNPLALPEREFLDRHLRLAHVDEVRVCREIPIDRRHNAKIDYPRLSRLLSST